MDASGTMIPPLIGTASMEVAEWQPTCVELQPLLLLAPTLEPLRN